MSQQQETPTDRLVSIIQRIQLGRGTGLLTARRGTGITFEEGTILFVNGKVTETRAGRRTGAEALNWLSTWGHCHYLFVASVVGPAKRPLPPIQPSYNVGTDASVDTNATPYLATSPFRKPLNISETEQGNTGELRLVPTTDPRLGTIAPFHIRQLESALRVIEHMGLSRAHRRLFLLVDGQRSVQELARLTGRSDEEVYHLLRDLENATVIRLSRSPM